MLQTRLYEVEEAARAMSAPDGDKHLYDLDDQIRYLNVMTGSPAPSSRAHEYGHDTAPASPDWPVYQNNMYSSLPPEDVGAAVFSEEVLVYLIQTFFRDIVPVWYPNPIHQTTFNARFPNHSPLLIYSMCAAAARRSDHPVSRAYVSSRNVPLYRAGEPYFFKARELIQGFVGQPDYETVLSLVVLGQAVAGMGLVDSSVQLMTMAIQTALNLRLDVDPDDFDVHGPLTWLEKESRRRLWWTLCMPSIDIDFGALSGRLARVFYEIQSLHQSLHGSPDPSISIALHEAVPPAAPAPSVPATRAALEIESLLAVELQAILGSLPEWGRRVDLYTEFSPLSTSRSPPPWQLLTQHIVVHALSVCLYLPTVLGAADQLRHLHHHPPPPPSSNGFGTSIPSPTSSTAAPTDPIVLPPHVVTSYHRCRYHATLVASFLRKIMAVNPTARWIDWYTLYLAFRSALVFVVVLKTEVDREELVHARKDLEIHLEVMRSVGRHMWFASWITKMVEGIIMDA
ncbi:hypothetical protein HKX48_006116 [Thoreauomyces humboldtii]|nr:hypothetical protein HKX48_006116 [Thoreauomyces humboldtii]